MIGDTPKVFSIAPGAAFLPTLADALLDGRLVPGFRYSGEPLALADVSIFLPTRRAARELRSVFVDRLGGKSAILPVIRPLGEFDEDAVSAEEDTTLLDLAPAVSQMERVLALAPLVERWKSNLPRHVASMFSESLVVPASTADALWLARDLGTLLDEVETQGANWSDLAALVDGELAGWWQVTLEFLAIVTEHWPDMLAARDRSDPALHRNAMIDAETARLVAGPPRGPVIAAGSTGSIPATARLLSAVARLDLGAVVLPGLDLTLDTAGWDAIDAEAGGPSVCGHPQFGLKRLLDRIGVDRTAVREIGEAGDALRARMRIVADSLRPAETTETWATGRLEARDVEAAFDGVALVEAANPREEALAIAVALREAVGGGAGRSALVSVDRELARRVSSELLRFGIVADDSGGSPLATSEPATLLRLLLETVFRPGDPVALLSLMKHPLLRLGRERSATRSAMETAELILLRGGIGRPDIASVAADFERRLTDLGRSERMPFWMKRMDEARIAAAGEAIGALGRAVSELAALRDRRSCDLRELLASAVSALEALAAVPENEEPSLYEGEAGEAFASFLESLLHADETLEIAPREFPDVLVALIAGSVVKPPAGADPRVSILGALEARLQNFDLLVLGGLNEGSWPKRAENDRFLSRFMKSGLSLDPPERRIGQSAHDFWMASGNPRLLMTRAARAGDAPAVASRWVQRLLTCAGPDAASSVRARGRHLLDWARTIDVAPRVAGAARPEPAPPLEVRPTHFSFTEIETLRRDPYAIYARRILRLQPLDPLLREPAAAERGTLFHEILHRFTEGVADPRAPDAESRLLQIARACFGDLGLPADVEAVWWPRFVAMAPELIAWESGRAGIATARHAEAQASLTKVGATGVSLHGRADRIDRVGPAAVDILDYKTGSSPTAKQARVLLSPQLALEAALLKRGAFAVVGEAEPADLIYVRLKPDGSVKEESILSAKSADLRSAADMAEEAWSRLERLLAHYNRPATGYLSRSLPFREGAVDGPYDHLARVLEWSSGGDPAEGGDA